MIQDFWKIVPLSAREFELRFLLVDAAFQGRAGNSTQYPKLEGPGYLNNRRSRSKKLIISQMPNIGSRNTE